MLILRFLYFIANKPKLTTPEIQPAEINKPTSLRLGTHRAISVQGNRNQNPNSIAQDSWTSRSSSNLAASVYYQGCCGPLLDT